jgi:hypothetical protein
MSEANDDGQDGAAIAITVNAGEEGAGEPEGGGELAEGLEAAADAAVEIARIEADRDVTLAVIQADTEEARAERYSNEDLEQCRTEIARLEGALSVALTELEALRPSTPEPLTEPEPPNPPQDLPSGEADGPRESPVEPAAVEEAAPEPPPKAKPKVRWI